MDVVPSQSGAHEKRSPPIVGVGASAGGLDSFIRFVSHLSSDSGLAYVLVQHLDPAHASRLSEILERASTVPVIAAADGIRMEANHAYVMPPNVSMTVTDGQLRVEHCRRARGAQTVIDRFLRSLGEVHRSDAVGVILSGSGSDGSHGIEAIKEYGGVTLAQDPLTAQVPAMPQNAIATGCVDFVLSPEQIAEQLSRIARHLRRPGHRGRRS